MSICDGYIYRSDWGEMPTEAQTIIYLPIVVEPIEAQTAVVRAVLW